MCGACLTESLVSYRPGEVVEAFAGPSSDARVGRIADIDPNWGVAVSWSDGSNHWFEYELVPANFEKGFSMVITDASRFKPSGDANAGPAAEDVGRGWLRRPPAAAKAPVTGGSAPRGGELPAPTTLAEECVPCST